MRRPRRRGPPAAEDELLGLDEELDLADAAAPELDVVAGDRDLVMAAHGVDLPLHRVHVGDRGEIEIFAPDERREVVEEALAEREVAGDRARLDEGGALPVLPDGLVIGVGGGERDGGRRRARVGAQPIVDAVHVAVAGALLEQAREVAGDAGVEGRRLDALCERRRGRVEEDDEVDVARIVQLAGAVLAERQDHEAGAGAWIVGIGELDLAVRRGL